MIKVKPKGQERTFSLADKALKLGDLLLALKFRDMAINYFLMYNDIDGYITACKKSLKMESEFPERSEMYEVTIAHLLDALIFKQQGSDSYIEELLFQLYNSPDFQLKSFSLYAKYIGVLEKNDPSLQRIFKIFGVQDLHEFFALVIKKAKGNLNDNELYYLYHEASVAAYYHGDYGTSFSFGNDKTYLVKKIYSSELSQTIADYQTQEVAREKEFKVQKEKAKSRLYFVVSLVVVFFLIISIYLVFIYIKKSKILAIRNKEKEMLVKEINHRVKNNFQLVNSLLELQTKEIDDEATIKKLYEGQSRIKAMSLIHQKLYQTEYLGLVDFKEYSEQLTQLMLSMVNFDKVRLQLEVEKILLDIDTAIPLGLILNELFTNSLKYALTNKEGDFVKLEIRMLKEHEFIFTYSDSGKGIQAFEPVKGTGMGIRLIKSLTKQLQGNLTLPEEGSSKYIIEFKDKQGRKQLE